MPGRPSADGDATTPEDNSLARPGDPASAEPRSPTPAPPAGCSEVGRGHQVTARVSWRQLQSMYSETAASGTPICTPRQRSCSSEAQLRLPRHLYDRLPVAAGEPRREALRRGPAPRPRRFFDVFSLTEHHVV